ncbi:MAG: hypothetical protein ABSE42_10280 [Bryobacteraceae bacterium]
MSAAERTWNWIGVVLTLACFGTVVAGNTELVWRFEHAGFPLSWVLAGAAILAFLATEFCDSTASLPDEAEDASSQFSSEWETVELQS